MIARNKKLLSYLLKLGILILAGWFIYNRMVKDHDNLHRFSMLAAHISQTRVVVTLSAVVLLMLANWGLESLKWLYLSRPLGKITLWQSIESVFCGLTWAIFTPNRFGEYGGRVMYLPVRRRIHGVFAMAVGGFSQNAITNVLGAVAVVWFMYSFLHPAPWFMAGSVLFNTGLIVFMLVFYFKIKWLVRLLNRVKFLHKFHRFFDIMGKYSTTQLVDIMCFSLARFFAFTLQYYLVIHLFIPDLPAVPMVLMTLVFLFVQSAIPSFDVVDVAVRGATADKIFGYITDQHIAIVVAVSIIYIVNIVIPAIIGSVFVLNVKFFDRTA